MIFKVSSKTLSKICAIKQFRFALATQYVGYISSQKYSNLKQNLMTTLLSETFAGMEVIFVDEANPRNLQMSGDSFLQMRSVSVLVVSFFVCMWCIRGCAFR